MPSQEEKLAFANRLKQALTRSPKRIETAAELALNFNLRHPTDPITPQAAQKWLSGQALPTIDKIATLSEWLDVSLAWLGLGVVEHRSGGKSKSVKVKRAAEPPPPPTAEELELLEKLRTLSGHKRYLLIQVLDQFVLDDSLSQD
jgi:transcriptional regulator with XRE-family HTH domain